MKKLANYVSAAVYGDGGVFGVGSQQRVISEKSHWEALVAVAAAWKVPSTSEGVFDIVSKNYKQFDTNLIKTVIAEIQTGDCLIFDGHFYEPDRYSRNALYYNYLGASPTEFQENLNRSSVCIVGCGGIGNHVSSILTGAGVGKITLVDDDLVEISNLTRQVLFCEADVGQKKTAVLARELRKRNSSITVETLDLRICTASDVSELPQSDLIILSADYPSNLIDWINSECVKRKWAYVNAGYANDISVVGPFYVPGKTGCFRCRPVAPTLCDDAIYPMRDELAAINHGFKPATFAPVNNIAAAIAASDSIKYLGKHGEILSLNRRVGIHSRSIKIEVQDLLKSEDCHVCGTA